MIRAGFLHRELFHFLCRFKYRRTVNKTACSTLWHSLSKFVLSLGSQFSRQLEGFGLLGSEIYVKFFLQSLEHEFAACILKAKKAQSRGVSFHLCSPRSQSRNPSSDGIDPCLTDRGDPRHLRKCKLLKS